MLCEFLGRKEVTMEIKFVKIEVYIPEQGVQLLHDALNQIGILTIGNYDYCLAMTKVKGYFRPLKGANPHIGDVGTIEEVDEIKCEFRCPYNLLNETIQVIKQVHPYEEPVYHILPILNE